MLFFIFEDYVFVLGMGHEKHNFAIESVTDIYGYYIGLVGIYRDDIAFVRWLFEAFTRNVDFFESIGLVFGGVGVTDQGDSISSFADNVTG